MTYFAKLELLKKKYDYIFIEGVNQYDIFIDKLMIRNEIQKMLIIFLFFFLLKVCICAA